MSQAVRQWDRWTAGTVGQLDSVGQGGQWDKQTDRQQRQQRQWDRQSDSATVGLARVDSCWACNCALFNATALFDMCLSRQSHTPPPHTQHTNYSAHTTATHSHTHTHTSYTTHSFASRNIYENCVDIAAMCAAAHLFIQRLIHSPAQLGSSAASQPASESTLRETRIVKGSRLALQSIVQSKF